VELASTCIVVMDNEWNKLDPTSVRLDDALQEVCFWAG